jgi:hypothetical protein
LASSEHCASNPVSVGRLYLAATPCHDDFVDACPWNPAADFIFTVGLLTWKNYQRTAEIWAENVRSRGLDKIGIGWFMDTGTARAIGAGKAIFTSLFAVTGLVQALWR